MAKHVGKCAKCGARLEFDSAVGERIVCSQCGASLTIPRKTQPQAADDSKSPTITHAPPAPKTDPLIGHTLGEFEITELLGRGGMGAVYKARQPSLDRTVAIKVLPARLATDCSFVVRFIREARSAAAVRHPNIIEIFAVGEADGHQFIAMEFIEGETLADTIKREGHLTPERGLEILKHTALALDAAHACGILHRDIKPSNILIDTRGWVKVADFGLAKQTDTDISITVTGQALGTPLYIPPEAARGQKLDARSDLYSLGATFYHAFAGRPPFLGNSGSELILKHAEAQVPPLQQLVPDVPAPLCRIIHRLLRKKPADRFDSAEKLLEALARIGPVGGTSPSRTGPVGGTSPSRAKSVGGVSVPRVSSAGTETLPPDARSKHKATAGKKGVGGASLPRVLPRWMWISAPIVAITLLVLTLVLWPKGTQPPPKATVPPSSPEPGTRNPKPPPSADPAEAAYRKAESLAAAGDWAAARKVFDAFESRWWRGKFYARNRKAIDALSKRIDTGRKATPPVQSPTSHAIAPWYALCAAPRPVGAKGVPPARLKEQIRFADGVLELDGRPGYVAAYICDTACAARDLLVRGQVRMLGRGIYGDAKLRARVEPSWMWRATFRASGMVEFCRGRGAENKVVEQQMPPADGDGFRRFEFSAIGGAVRLRVGKGEWMVAEDPAPAKGFSGLDARPGCRMQFRDLRVQVLDKGWKPPAWLKPVAPAMPRADAEGWVSLFDGKTLDGWRVPATGRFAKHGNVAVTDGALVLETGDPDTGVAWTGDVPRNNYEIAIEVAGPAQGQACHVMFPFSEHHLLFAISPRPGAHLLVGLANVNGKAANTHPVVPEGVLVSGPNHEVRLRVTPEALTAWLNGRQIWQFRPDEHQLSSAAAYKPMWPFGVLVHDRKPLAVRSIRLRRLKPEGEAKVVPWKVYTAWPFNTAEAKRRQAETAKALGVPVEQDIEIAKGVKMTMVLIPAGEFLMGNGRTTTPEQFLKVYGLRIELYQREFPGHRVKISKPFWLGKTEVTQAQWQAVMGNNPSRFNGEPENPVEQVNWHDCQGFLQKLSAKYEKTFRLPTEAEWEHACRAGSPSDFYFGDSAAAVSQHAWWGINSGAMTHPVGRNKPNAWGLHDMAGNVWEWCEDWYRAYGNAPQVDPKGPEAGDARVLRGGSWRLSNPGRVRCAGRSYFVPEDSGDDLGFRAARTLDAAPEAPAGAEPARPPVEQEEPRADAAKAGPWKVYTPWPFDTAEAKRRQAETAKALGVPVEQDIEIAKGVKMTMVLIPAGEFLMGSRDSAEQVAKLNGQGRDKSKYFTNEHPQHRVTITKPFWVSKCEVTQEQWEAVMSNNPSRFKGEKNPVETVSWDDIQGFLKKANARLQGQRLELPTEAQWEYACRAGTATPFCFGETISTDQANYNGNFTYGNGRKGVGRGKTMPVGSFLANAWGLHDMHGNVWEWCSDWHSEYTAGAQTNPTGPAEGRLRVLRGGSWYGSPVNCRSADRPSYAVANTVNDYGFRVCGRIAVKAMPREAQDKGPRADEARWGPWEELFDGKTLKGWQIPERWDFEKHGEVLVRDGCIVLSQAAPRGLQQSKTGVAWNGLMPRDDYEVSFEAMGKRGGADFCNTVFPVGVQGCGLKIGSYWESRVALYYVDGLSAHNIKNPTITGMSFKQGRWYRLRVRVTRPRVEVWIDERQVINLARGTVKLRLSNAPLLLLAPFGFYSNLAEGRVRRVRVRRLKPEAKAGPWSVYTKWPFDTAEAKRRQAETAKALGVPVEQDIEIAKGVKMTMVLIPAGEFLMGSPPTTSPEQLEKLFGGDIDRYRREFPQHPVKISKPFWLGKTEVTQAQWQAVMGDNPSKFNAGPTFPVETVSWDDCDKFVDKVNETLGGGEVRLPMEAEWEFACRCGAATMFSFGDATAQLSQFGWFKENSGERTHPVARLKPNAWGLHDIVGNVYEWCGDWYFPYAPKAHVKRGWGTRVSRGGSSKSLPASCRSAYRNANCWELRHEFFGLRLAKSLP